MSWQEELWQVLTTDYHLEPRLLEQYDTVYRLYTANGIYAIKEVKYPKEEFAYIFAATEHLRANGFSHINYMLLNVEGTPCFTLGEKKYFIAPWLPGRQLDYTVQSDVVAAATTLGKLHGASTGFTPPYFKGRVKWGELIENFKTKLTQMESWQTRFTGTAFSREYAKALPEMMALGREVLTRLTPVYGDFNRAEEQWSGFCHHDYAPHNIVLSPEGVGQVIDFDYCISDTAVHDLASLMCRIMKKNEFREDLSLLAWQEYQKERLLPKGAKEVTVAFLLFPQEFWQCGFTYFVEQNRPETKMEKRLQGVLETAAAKEKAVRNLAKWI